MFKAFHGLLVVRSRQPTGVACVSRVSESMVTQVYVVLVVANRIVPGIPFSGRVRGYKRYCTPELDLSSATQ